jgi:predicted dehydrogenase
MAALPDVPLTRTHADLGRPRIGFAGVGWIGLNRLQAIAARDCADVVCIMDLDQAAARAAAARVAHPAREPRVLQRFEELLEEPLDGIVIATPSGLHAPQSIAALSARRAVFCQKPLARTAREAREVIAAARRSDQLLEIDFCYRLIAGVPQLMDLIHSGELGEIYAVDLTFHNAYGPDKPWFYDLEQSGGGCLMDLGIHLLDLLLLALDYPGVRSVSGELRAQGKLLGRGARVLEDYAIAEIHLENAVTARLACSWRLPAGQDAVITAAFYGTRGAGVLRNLDGSFYRFAVEHHTGTSRRSLAAEDQSWGGRTACAWVRRVAAGHHFDPRAERIADVAAVIDAIYGR